MCNRLKCAGRRVFTCISYFFPLGKKFMTNHTSLVLQRELAQTAKQAARESTQWPTRKTGPKTSPYESFLLITKYKSIMGNSKKPEGSGGKGGKKNAEKEHGGLSSTHRADRSRRGRARVCCGLPCASKISLHVLSQRFFSPLFLQSPRVFSSFP